MIDKRKSLALALGAAAALSGQATPAQESSAPSGSLLEEVVVTAQRREERIQDVPIAISAFSEAQLQQLNVTQTIGIVKLIPNLLGFNNTGLGTANGYYLRGIGNTESIPTFDPPVGTYVDDVFIARQNANNFGLFDMDRIEVLRGPQGTLFGRNTTGGAVNLIMKKPAKELGGYAEAGFGQFGLVSGRASVDVPFSDKVLTKFSAYYIKDDGYISDPVTGEDDLNYTKAVGVRAAVRFLLSDSVTWDLSAQHGRDEGENLLNFVTGTSGRAYRFNNPANALISIPAEGPQVELVPQRAGLLPTSTSAQSIEARCRGVITKSRFYCTGLSRSGTPLAGIFTGEKQNYNLGNETRNTLVVSNLQWKTGLGDLQFITGYNKLHQEYALDFFNGTVINTAAGSVATNPAGGFTLASTGDFKQFSQEIKLIADLNDNVRYVAGLYYFDERADSDFGDFLGTGPTTGLVLEDRILKNKARAIAAYTQWDLKFAQAWTLTLGGRYTDERKEIDFIANPNPRVLTPANARVSSANLVANGIPLKLDTGLFTPRVALKFDLSDDVNFFVSATNGFKSGGWNARGTSAIANQPFSPEKVWSYEAGMRSDLFDRKLRVNLTAFHLDVKDLQTPAAFVSPVNGAITFITRNFSDLKNDGLEAEIIWSPVREMNLFALVGIQNAKYENIAPSILQQQAGCLAAIAGGTSTANLCNSGIVDPSGRIAEPVRTPDTLTLGASYALPVGANYTLTPNIIWAHSSKHNVGTSGAPAGLSDSYSTIDGGVTFAPREGNWSVQANCRNCTDEVQVVSLLSDLPYIQAPRTWSVTFRYNFGTR